LSSIIVDGTFNNETMRVIESNTSLTRGASCNIFKLEVLFFGGFVFGELRSPDEWVETILIVVVFTLNTIESSRCIGSVQIMPERP
jgi:hypothetical protein